MRTRDTCSGRQMRRRRARSRSRIIEQCRQTISGLTHHSLPRNKVEFQTSTHRFDLAQSVFPAAALGVYLPIGFPGVLSAKTFVLHAVKALAEPIAVLYKIVMLYHGGWVRICELRRKSVRMMSHMVRVFLFRVLTPHCVVSGSKGVPGMINPSTFKSFES